MFLQAYLVDKLLLTIGETMKKTVSLFCAILAASIYTNSAHASCTDGTGCLQVPGDFSQPVNNFNMYLLGGWFNIESSLGNGQWAGITGATSLTTTGKQISFTATKFDDIGLGQGTSILNADLNHVVLGSGTVFGITATIYADGLATGTLVDNIDSTQGHWTLTPHLFADWNGINFDLGIMDLTTNASYTYTGTDEICDIDLDCLIVQKPGQAISGYAMNYYSGLAQLVGQGIIKDNPVFQGLRFTVSLQGQDPLAAPSSVVPVPGAVWLLGSGLFGLAGFARKCNTA